MLLSITSKWGPRSLREYTRIAELRWIILELLGIHNNKDPLGDNPRDCWMILLTPNVTSIIFAAARHDYDVKALFHRSMSGKLEQAQDCRISTRGYIAAFCRPATRYCGASALRRTSLDKLWVRRGDKNVKESNAATLTFGVNLGWSQIIDPGERYILRATSGDIYAIWAPQLIEWGRVR